MRILLLLFCISGLLSTAEAQTMHTVRAGNFFYNPEVLTITVGDTVLWINQGGFHNVNADINTLTGMSYNNPESFSSAATSSGVLLERVFTVAGTYGYDCSVGSHAANGMVGTVIVNEVTSSTTDIQQGNINSFSVFHALGSQSLQVEFKLKKAITNAMISVHSMNGQYLANEAVSTVSGDNLHVVDLSTDIPTGVYIVSLFAEGTRATTKLFVE